MRMPNVSPIQLRGQSRLPGATDMVLALKKARKRRGTKAAAPAAMGSQPGAVAVQTRELSETRSKTETYPLEPAIGSRGQRRK